MVRHVVEDEVVALPASGEVLGCVVDDMVSADGPDHLLILCAAHAGHLSAERFGDLHGESPDAAGSAVDQDLLAWLDVALIAKKLEGGRCRHADGGGLLKSQVGGLGHEMFCCSARVLGKSAGTPTEHLIAGFQIRDAVA